MSLSQTGVQPGFRVSPVTLYRAGRDAEDRRYLLVGKTAEEPQFDHACLALVDLSELIEGPIDSQNPFWIVIKDDCGISEFFLLSTQASFCGRTTSGVIDQNPPHRPRCHSEEMGAVVPVLVLTSKHPHEHLIDQRRRLQRMPGSLPAEMVCSHPSQLCIQAAQQPFFGYRIASSGLSQE
jgi:hypothetical protein